MKSTIDLAGRRILEDRRRRVGVAPLERAQELAGERLGVGVRRVLADRRERRPALDRLAFRDELAPALDRRRAVRRLTRRLPSKVSVRAAGKRVERERGPRAGDEQRRRARGDSTASAPAQQHEHRAAAAARAAAPRSRRARRPSARASGAPCPSAPARGWATSAPCRGSRARSACRASRASTRKSASASCASSVVVPVQVELGLHRPVAAAQLAERRRCRGPGARTSARARTPGPMSHVCGAGSSPYFDASSTSRSSASVWRGDRRGRGTRDGARVRAAAASARRRTRARGRCRRRRASPRRSRAAATLARAAGRGGARAGFAAWRCAATAAAASSGLQVGSASRRRARLPGRRASARRDAPIDVGLKLRPRCHAAIAARRSPSRIRLGVERRHAAGAGRRDRLPVDVVGDVARGEHAGHADVAVALPSVPPFTLM